MAFNRAITPGKPTTARMTTLIDEFFGQVSRTMDDGASGPEAFTLLLRPLVTHFDPVDTEEGYTKLHTFGVCNGTLLLFLSGVPRVGIGSYGDGCGVGGGSDGGK